MADSRLALAATGLLLLFCLAYAFLIPVFQAPDEPAHFARAYGLAEGQFVLRDHPKELIELILKEMGKHKDIEHLPIFQDIRKTLQSSADRVPNIAYNTSQYIFLPYMFHAGLIKLVRLVVEHPKDLIISVYTCRIASALLYCFIFYLAVTQAPGYIWPLFWIAATPMALSQGAMLSIDVLIFCSGLIVLCAGLARPGLKVYAGLVWPAAFILITSKPPYAPLILSVAGAAFVCADRWKRLGIIAAACLPGLAVIFLWKEIVLSTGIYEHTMSYINLYISPDISPAEQINNVLDSPWSFVLVLKNTLLEQGPYLYHQLVGILGWQDLEIPFAAVAAWTVMLPVALMLAAKSVQAYGPGQVFLGIGYLAAGLLTMVFILLALYLVWMPVGANLIHAQGRYFHLPVLAGLMGLVMLLPRMNLPRLHTSFAVIMLCTAGLVNMMALYKVVARYWL